MTQFDTVAITPFDDQKPGTSGLRKSVRRFQTPHYLESFVQAIFNTQTRLNGGTLVVGGDGRYFSREAIQIILRMCAANGVGRVIVGRGGFLSTPAISHLIRQQSADGGIILSASHNPGGPEGDFGVKFNSSNGGPASEDVTTAIYEAASILSHYAIAPPFNVDIEHEGSQSIGNMQVDIVDPVNAYAELMRRNFDFPAISEMFAEGFTMCFDAMNAVSGPYATRILETELGAPAGTVIRGEPLPDFGGCHPDPNPQHAHKLFDIMFGENPPNMGAASDGDADRNIVLGPGLYVTPSDSLAILCANARSIPQFSNGLKGVARSAPTSRAVDRVAAKLGINSFATPTGWKYFGSLLDAELIDLCGEESAGTGSDHIREKDGLWAVLMWLNILAVRKLSVRDLVQEHWEQFGRDFYQRHDFEGVDTSSADDMMNAARASLREFVGRGIGPLVVTGAREFDYQDPVTGIVTQRQGHIIEFGDEARFMVRKSGTGTSGATVRVYVERYVRSGDMSRTAEDVLSNVLEAAMELLDIERRLSRTKADVIA